MIAWEGIALFRNLSRDEWQAISSIARERHFTPGEVIFCEEEPGDGVYFVKEGLVEISSLISTGTRRMLSQLGPGEIFGEMAVIENRPRSATATALKASEVYFLPRDEMLSLIQRSPVLALNLLQEISHRLREFNHIYLREVLQAERLTVVGNFARSIVHDLKNPLSIIGISAETLDMPKLRPEFRAQAQNRIRKQVERINDMVSDILIFTENNPGNAGLRAGDYRAFVLELIADLRAEAELKSVRIEMPDGPPALPIPFDPRRLSRVFHNLVNNATDMMLSGGAIFLRFQPGEKEIVTEIQDTGPGIAPEIADKLFEAFATFGKAHGTGLGLSICKKIIEDHQGRIWARNAPGGGAIFSFALPLSN